MPKTPSWNKPPQEPTGDSPTEQEQPTKIDDSKPITITKGELRSLISEVREGFEKELAENRRQIDILTEAADLKRLSNATAKREGPIVRTVRLTTHEGKIVVAWKMIMDTVEKNATTGVWTEKQVMRITLDDDTEVDLNYLQFAAHRKDHFVIADIIGKVTDEMNGDITYKLKRQDNGKDISIASAFVN